MLLIKNANIYTRNALQPHATSLLIQNGKVIACGDEKDAYSWTNDKVDVLDFKGKTILPGFTDSHLHLMYLGKNLTSINCETKTKQECLSRVSRRVIDTPKNEWILGHGWNQNNWEGGFGTRNDLDRISTDHPIYLTAKSLHAAWVNSKALELAGIGEESPDPAGGYLGRNADGSLNGILFESALTLVETVIPPLEGEKLTQLLDLTQQHLWAFGITAVHDFDGSNCFSGLQTLESKGKLRLRVLKGIPADDLDAAIQFGLKSGFGSDYIKIGSLKLFADGALGPQTAAMLSPYEGQENNKGVLLLDREEITSIGMKAASNGIGIAIHAIGDLANRVVLDAYQRIRDLENKYKIDHYQHRIEHVQVLHPADVTRLQELDIIASVQPIHLVSDMETADRYWGKRAAYAYAFNALLSANTRMIFGSDAPVESANPFWGLFAAVNRKKFDGKLEKDGWYPEQCISLDKALDAYTVNPGQVSGFKIGQLAPGYFADLIVLNDDPFQIDPEELKDLSPEATMVAGEWVWKKKEE